MAIDIQPTLSAVRTAHHTTKYKTADLVVRRGQSVRLTTDATPLSASLVPVRSARRLSGSYSVRVTTSSTDQGWTLLPVDGESAQVDLYIPVTAKVGRYRLRDLSDRRSRPVSLVVLFNPYSSEDTVHLDDPDARREYVQAEAGRRWCGGSNSFSGMAWTYAQFRTKVLLSAIDLLDRIPTNKRHDPVHVTRELSALLNSSDADSGVVTGNWSGDYAEGFAPTAWTGSLDILTSYWDSGSRPVRYGQCWVFAGVFTSVCRALGIPCMPISNFSSAHENKPYNRLVELYYDVEGKPIPRRARGSTWNFHVWNMVWMKRDYLAQAQQDHGLNYDGWQVVDGTPQETSGGLHQLGPCPVEAVKNGFNVDFDADFVISEVNADMAYHVQRGATRWG